MPQSIPFWNPGDYITGRGTDAITGARFVSVTAAANDGNPSISHTGAGEAVHGVAAYDAPAGAPVTFYTEGVAAVTAGAVITAGDRVASDAEGRAIPAVDPAIAAGTAFDDVASGGIAKIKLNL